MFEFRGVTKVFGNQIALNDLSFSVKSKEFVALVGNNGSGKTTLIKALCNLIPYNQGSIFIFNRKLTPYYVSYKSKVGVFLSEPLLINEFTPAQYLKFICRFQRLKTNESTSRAAEILTLFCVTDFEKKKIIDYSSGDKVKISLAASLIHNPELLVFDEPFIHLDIKTLDLVQDLLLSFRGSKTLLITSHNLDLIHNLCKRILIIDKGQIIDEISNSEQISFQSLKENVRNKLKTKKTLSEQPKWLI